MEEGQPSGTAVDAAIYRAAHLAWDHPPKIFEDTLALKVSGCADQAALRAAWDVRSSELAAAAGRKLAQAILTFARALAAMRARFVEDELDRAIRRGVAQYVILGAGLDSFAYRRPELANALRVLRLIIRQPKLGSAHACAN